MKCRILRYKTDRPESIKTGRKNKKPQPRPGGISIGSGLLRFYIGIEGGIGGFGIAGPGIAELLGLR